MEPDDSAAPISVLTDTWAEIDPDEGGDPACWAHEICQECGRVPSDGHLETCSLSDGD